MDIVFLDDSYQLFRYRVRMAKRQKQISVTVDELHLQSLARLSEESGRSPAEIAREALHRYLWQNDVTFRNEKQRRIDSITKSFRVKDSEETSDDQD